MPAAEVKVTIVGLVSVTFNDFTSGAPAYLLRNTPELLATPAPRRTRVDRQGEHGIRTSVPLYEPRELEFVGEIIGSSQADRKAKEEDLKRCLALRTLQDNETDDAYLLVQIEDEDGTLKQCQAQIDSDLVFHVLDNTDPTRRGFEFTLLAPDPYLYGQSLATASGVETYQGTNFSIIQDASPRIPFSIIHSTVVSATCNNAGTADAPPVITIYGPTVSPVVTNVTSGRYFKLDGLTLAAGQSVKVNVSSGSIIKNDGTDASGYWDVGGDLFVLLPGANSITLLDSSPSLLEATFDIQWRPTYV